MFYKNKYFAFDNGYIDSIGISCSVGEIPQIQSSFQIYGDIGPNFNPSGDNGSMDGVTNFMKNYYIGGIDVDTNGQSYINSNNTFGGKRPTL